MPISKSAKRAYRVSETKRARNEQLKVRLKKIIKRPPKEPAQIQQVIDKIAKLHIISRKRADRLKSRLVSNITHAR